MGGTYGVPGRLGGVPRHANRPVPAYLGIMCRITFLGSAGQSVAAGIRRLVASGAGLREAYPDELPYGTIG